MNSSESEKNVPTSDASRDSFPAFGLLLASWLCLFMSPLSADEWHFQDVERIVAVGDVHGAYDALVETLQVADVIDDSLVWSGAGTHLVMTGDLLDRGPDSRQVMDLIMRLEQEAATAGGQVHQLLGNHEVMNLIGDVRYVSDPEFAAFADEESAQEREQWYQHFKLGQSTDTDEQETKAEFDKLAPPGFFGYRRAFRSDGAYGKWLLEKPLMIVINSTAFAHGGAPPYVAEHGLEGVNGTLKMDLRNYVNSLSALEDAGILSPLDRFREHGLILAEKLQAGQLDEAFIASAQAIIELDDSPIHGAAGPLWYRGTTSCNRLIEGDGLNAALGRIGATRIVNGHSTTVTRNVQQRMDGRIIEIDTGMLKASYEGSGNALLIEDGLFSVVNQDGTTDLTPVVHPMHVGSESESIDDESLEDLLHDGMIVDPKTHGASWKLVQVVGDQKTVLAYFNALPEEKGFVPELAAYRLDRMLGLYMVPVTVRRTLAGQQGTLQYVPAATISERERVADGKGDRARCSMDRQRGAMYVFDALIHNPQRTPLSMLYSEDNWQLILVNHDSSFGAGEEWPAYLPDVGPELGDQWQTTLLELTDGKLRSRLGDVLDDGRLAALAKRRDSLVESSR